MDEDAVRKEYDECRGEWDRFRQRLHELIDAFARELTIECQVHSRVKSWSSVAAKLARRNWSDLTQLTDNVGLRIVVNSWEDVDSLIDKLQQELSVTLSEDARWFDDPRYQSRRLTVGIDKPRSELPEWQNFRTLTAELQIRSAFADSWAMATHGLSYKVSAESPASDKITIAVDQVEKLSRAVKAFEELLNKDDVHEKKDIHPFLKDNTFILHPNPDDVLSEVQIGVGKQYVLDFLIREADGPYVVVEIENPRHAIVNKNGDISAPVNHAHQQVEDWQEWIEDNLPTVQKRFPDMSAPQGLVVIGRSNAMTTREARKLARRNINLRGRLKYLVIR